MTVPRNADIDGVSIRDALEGGVFDRGYLYWHYPHISPQDNTSATIVGGTLVSAIADERWKMIFFYNDRHYELYDLVNDIGETTNVLGQNPDVAYELSQALYDFLNSSGAQMPIKKSTNLPVPLPTILLLGDYDHDGVVAAADYDLWKSTFGSVVAAGTGADGTDDGLVTAADYTVWRNHLGEGVGVGAGVGSGSINTGPEPGAIALGILGLVLCCGCRRSPAPLVATGSTATNYLFAPAPIIRGGSMIDRTSTSSQPSKNTSRIACGL